MSTQNQPRDPVPVTEPHWYMTFIDACPACLSERVARERRPGARPVDPSDRYEHVERWDYCQ